MERVQGAAGGAAAPPGPRRGWGEGAPAAPAAPAASAAAAPARLRATAREAIRRLIASGRLSPGDRLNEAALSAELGVSRSPIREALRELEQAGLVVSYPNRGCFVADLTAADVEEVVLLRAWLEGLAARLAADRVNRRDLAELESTIETMARIGRDPAPETQAFVEADAAFHSAVIRLSGHRRLAAIWSGIDPLVWLIRTRHDPRVSDQAEALVAEHRELLAALRAGPDAAEAAARYHVVRGLDRPPRAWGPPLDGRAAPPPAEAPGPRERAVSGR